MIRWFTKNGVAANLLAAIAIVCGFYVASTIKLELFPRLDLDIVTASVVYPGAAPEEVESGIVELIEDRIQDLEGIKRMRSTASESYGAVVIEVERGYDAGEMRDNVKSRIDGITNFPQEAERPNVEELLVRSPVIFLALYGDTDIKNLKEIGEYIRDELNVRHGISQVDINGVAPYEISINISEKALRQYGLSFGDVALAIQRNSVDIPGGAIKSRSGEILLRTNAKAYRAQEFETLPVITNTDGALVTLGDIAEIEDGFVDDELVTEFNNERAVLLSIYALGNQGVLDIAERVRAFAEEVNGELPPGIEIKPTNDFTYYLTGRLKMLIENGIFGLILVFLVLTLFLRPSLAFFVMLGIPISFLGALTLLPWFDISINLASLFGFILVLGIVVDDAIIVGESIFTESQKQGGSGVEASVRGTHRVSTPVTFAVLTTVVAFIPILTMPGFIGKFFYPIPVVVIACLIWSLIESKLVLPYHLTLCKVGSGTSRENLNWLLRQQRKIADGMERFIEVCYRPLLALAIRFRYATVSFFIGLLAVVLSLLIGKHIAFVFFPEVPSDYMVAKLVMPEGTPSETTAKAVEKLESSLQILRDEVKSQGYGDPFENVTITVGGQPFSNMGGPNGSVSRTINPSLGEVGVELKKREDLADGGDIEILSGPSLAKRWRALTGPIAGVKELIYDANAAGQGGSPIDIQISGRDFDKLSQVAEAIKMKLATYQGLYDIRDNYSSGKREIRLELKPSAQALGLRADDLGQQVRAAFYGIEAQRIQRGRDDIKVMVRYPREERESLENLEELRIRTAGGDEVPFEEVAALEITQGFSSISRVDRRRVLNVTANADKEIADLEQIKADLSGKINGGESFLDNLLQDYPGVAWTFEGEAREQADIFASLFRTTILVLFIIYALLAVPLKSYLQPIIVMFVIPFGLIGAILGHVLLGQAVSILSILGFVALAGVVVNDSLVLVDFINQERKRKIPLREAIVNGCAARFRPIILTSLTTFAGLLPLLFETSLQAQFLIPMATSLSFGVLFATTMTLFLVPAFYNILQDGIEFILRIWKKTLPFG
ncbi:MAG: Swarming motility protein SwrC [Opitutia bacterium UBA7350]|nr:MAG: Swarming motility protein SwrC [Opitutae bacterium UBA7350]